MKLTSLVALLILSACGFSITEKKVIEEFSEKSQQPVISKVSVGERQIQFAEITNNKENLVVFIHGSPGGWNAFLDFFKNDTLLDLVDIISIDRPGYGGSDQGWPEPSMAKQSALMNAVTKKFPHKNKILVGHSLGGPVIARMAMDFPNEYKGLVFVAPSIDPDMEKKEWYRSLINTKVGGWVTPKDFWVSNEEIMPLKEELRLMIPLWSQIESESILIQGKKDMLVPWENGEFAKRMLPEEKLEVRYLEGVNHFIPWSNPETIVQAVLDLL